MHTWHDILKRLDSTDFAGTTDGILAQALLAVEAQDWMEAANLAELGCAFANGFRDPPAEATCLIVCGVAQAEMGRKTGMITLERAVTTLSCVPSDPSLMNAAIASIALASVTAASGPSGPHSTRDIAVRPYSDAARLLAIAKFKYAARGDRMRHSQAQELLEWIEERLDGAVPVKYIVQA